MENNKKKKNNGMSFYIALCCCVTLLGVISYINNRPAPKKISEINDTSKFVKEKNKITITPAPVSTPQPTESVNTLPVFATSDTKTDDLSSNETSNDDLNDVESDEDSDFYEDESVESVSVITPPDFTPPVNGTIIGEFDDKTLLYNSVLGDWRTHNGVDIKSNSGDYVYASSAGIIKEIYDGVYGNTIVMTHKNDFTTVYSNVENSESLQVGQKIASGQKIGTTSSEIPNEEPKQNHIHFEMYHLDLLLNPTEYIDFK